MKTEILVGHIDFYDTINHAIVRKIGFTKKIDTEIEDVDDAGERLMNNEYQSYICPDIYTGTIKYDLS